MPAIIEMHIRERPMGTFQTPIELAANPDEPFEPVEMPGRA